jgi:hypothetical protein
VIHRRWCRLREIHQRETHQWALGGHRPRFLLLKAPEISVCDHNLGFPERLVVRAKLGTLAAWWRGDISFSDARRSGLALEGPRELIRRFPDWFERYLFADIAPVRSLAMAAS